MATLHGNSIIYQPAHKSQHLQGLVSRSIWLSQPPLTADIFSPHLNSDIGSKKEWMTIYSESRCWSPRDQSHDNQRIFLRVIQELVISLHKIELEYNTPHCCYEIPAFYSKRVAASISCDLKRSDRDWRKITKRVADESYMSEVLNFTGHSTVLIRVCKRTHSAEKARPIHAGCEFMGVLVSQILSKTTVDSFGIAYNWTAWSLDIWIKYWITFWSIRHVPILMVQASGWCHHVLIDQLEQFQKLQRITRINIYRWGHWHVQLQLTHLGGVHTPKTNEQEGNPCANRVARVHRQIMA